MDPVTFGVGIFAVGAALATSQPKWDQLPKKSKSILISSPDNLITGTCSFDAKNVITALPPWARITSQTEYLVSGAKLQPGGAQRALLLNEISKYASLPDDWDDEGAVSPSIESLYSAISFIRSMPAGFLLPKPMLSTDGSVEFYWDLAVGYADISFDALGVGSFFRKLCGEEEFFASGLSRAAFNENWFASKLTFVNKREIALGHASFDLAA